MSKKTKKTRRRLPLAARILVVLLSVCVVFYAGVAIMVLWKEHHLPPTDAYDTIIILGAQVKPDGTPNLQLQWRLDAGFAAWQKQPCKIVVCGAQGRDEPAPEGEVMRDYLMKLGVPAEDILVDASSFNTRENLQHAAALLADQAVQTVLIVTSDYHLPRAMAIAEDLGFRATGIASRTLGGIYWLKNHLREPVAWIKYWVEKLFRVEIRSDNYTLNRVVSGGGQS